MTSLIDTTAREQESLPAGGGRRKRVALVIVSVMVLLVGAVFAWYLINRKPLSQLPGMPGGSAPHYLFSMYGASRPLGVAVNAAGDRVYVTQSDGPRVVQVYDGAGHPLGTLKPPASTGANHVPVYVAVNPTTQDVYVSDRLANAVYVYDSAGTYKRTVDTAKAKLSGSWKPLGLAFASDGTLYVTDLGPPARIVVLSPDGATAHTFGEKDGLSFPNGIAVDADGQVLVADSNNSRLLVYGKSETVAATLTPGTGAGSLGLPRGVAVGDGHRLYVVDTTDHMVRMYKLGSGQGDVPAYVASFGREGGIDGAFEYPNGVAVDSHARLYITDRENLRVQVWGY
jgi:DNA-binding beta-propeller fold protein YncE